MKVMVVLFVVPTIFIMKSIGFIFFFLIILALFIGAIVYVSNRFALFFPSTPRKMCLLSFGALAVITFLSVALFQITPSPIGRAVFIFAGITISLFLFLLMSIAVTDLFNLIFKFPFQTRGYLSIGLVLLLMIYSVWNAYAIKVKEVTIPIKGLTEEVRAVHVTDIHLGNFRGKRGTDKVVQKIKELNPEVIFNTGDMFDSQVHFGEGKDVLASFRTLDIPHYFVYGNHDQHVGVPEVVNQMKRANATVLLNEVTHFKGLQIIGLNNMLVDRHSSDIHAFGESENIEDTLDKLDIDEDMPTIVLHHRPDGVQYMEAKGTDLLLAGHTHAGQVFPFTYIAQWMFGYNRGLYKYKTMDIYVSEGIGTFFVPIRFLTSSEIILFKLTPVK